METKVMRIAGRDMTVVMCQLKGGHGCKHKTCHSENGVTTAQRARQSYRDSSGRYGEVFTCERCGKNAGYDYYSEPRLTEDGIGICLCGKCAGKLEAMDMTALNADIETWRG